MRLPPWLVRVGFQSWTFWVPLVLLWPIVFLAFIPLAFLSLLAATIVRGLSAPALARVFAELYRLLCALRGTELRFEANRSKVVVVFY
jgi:hypothetical protein